jgi:hypothetical protein
LSGSEKDFDLDGIEDDFSIPLEEPRGAPPIEKKP